MVTFVWLLILTVIVIFCKEAADASDWYDKISKY